MGVGVLGPNICMNLPGVDVVLHSKFQPLGTNGVATKSMRARIPLLYRFHTERKPRTWALPVMQDNVLHNSKANGLIVFVLSKA